MKIIEILKNKKTLSFEFFPPKGEEEFELFIETVKDLKIYNPDFVSVTDSQISAKMKHIALSKFLKEKLKLNPMVHLTCINNTSREIKNSLDAIEENGIRNILALRGDKKNFSKTSDEFKHSTDLLIKIPKEKFSVAVAAHPEGHPDGSLSEEFYYLKMKRELGAEFAITQIFFDNNVFLKFRDRAKKQTEMPILCGIMAVTTPQMIANIFRKTGKIKIPKKLLKILNMGLGPRDFIKYSIDFSTEQILELLKNGADGIHFFTFNRAFAVKKIIKNIGEKR